MKTKRNPSRKRSVIPMHYVVVQSAAGYSAGLPIATQEGTALHVGEQRCRSRCQDLVRHGPRRVRDVPGARIRARSCLLSPSKYFLNNFSKHAILHSPNFNHSISRTHCYNARDSHLLHRILTFIVQRQTLKSRSPARVPVSA